MARIPDLKRGKRLEELLDALEDIPADEQEAYLARVCPDLELRKRALSLRVVEADCHGYLDRLAEWLGRAPEPAASRDLSGRRVGAFLLSRLLGRGGMGVVYEAERADGAFEQRVALKLLTAALAGTEAHQRFLAERRILAGLEHPAIARMVDGGVAEDGTPWFAMEYVEGLPLDAYCDRRRLGIRARLELFLQVCDAVEHAHRRLVVHRDLKPANVLVTEDEKVKLLDFGIAKLLEPGDVAGQPPPTRTALRMMTPEYASPEQVRGVAVTTASDVYQLGYLLYELLSGHRPYPLRQRRAGELERAICEQAPTRLSAAIARDDTLKSSTSAAAGAVEEACRARRSSPARLRRRLRGDLENITAKALSKEPERRYGSADRLAQDLRRHLRGLPVTARADTWTYRGRKFLERHALGASVAALALVFVAVLTGFYVFRIQSERHQAQVERDRARVEAAKAREMSEFLAGLFGSADPNEARGAEITVREALDRGVERVDRDLAAQPEVQADMLHVLGRTYSELGLYDAAENLLTRALALRRDRLGPEHQDEAMIMRDLGLLRYRQGEYERARDLLQEADRILTESLGGSAPELADVLETLGQVHLVRFELDQGRTALERALKIQIRASGEASEATAVIMSRLATLFSMLGILERAENLYERALAIYERELGADHPQVGYVLMNLALVRAEQGKLDGVESMHRRSLAIQRKVYGPVHSMVGVALNNLGHFLNASGRTDEAIETLRNALDVYSAALGESHPRVAYPLASLGDAYLADGRLHEARDSYRQSVALLEEAVGSDEFHSILAHSLVRLGRIDAELGNNSAAEQNLTRALAVWTQAPETVDSDFSSSLLYLGGWLVEQHRCTEAVPVLRRALRPLPAEQHAPGSIFAELESLLAQCAAPATDPVAAVVTASPP